MHSAEDTAGCSCDIYVSHNRQCIALIHLGIPHRKWVDGSSYKLSLKIKRNLRKKRNFISFLFTIYF